MKNKTNNQAWNPMTISSMILLVIGILLLIVSSLNLFHEAQRFNLPVVSSVIFAAVSDVTIVAMITSSIFLARQGKKFVGRLSFAILGYASSLFFNLDNAAHWIPASGDSNSGNHDVNYGYLIITCVLYISFAILTIFEVFNFMHKYEEASVPVKEKARQYFIDQEVNGGQRLTGSSINKAYGVSVRTANDWLRSWRMSHGDDFGDVKASELVRS